MAVKGKPVFTAEQLAEDVAIVYDGDYSDSLGLKFSVTAENGSTVFTVTDDEGLTQKFRAVFVEIVEG